MNNARLLCRDTTLFPEQIYAFLRGGSSKLESIKYDCTIQSSINLTENYGGRQSMFRFIHTADIHLDSPLKSLALKDQQASELVANATRQCFANIIDLCIEEKVDVLIIAGDLYDGELRSMKTAEFFTSEMRRLAAAGVKAFIVRGNHDAESRITKELLLPDGVHVFSNKDSSFMLEEKEVVLHGVSFSKPHAPDSLLPSYPPRKTGYKNIGILHTSLAGSAEHDTYAPCSLQDLLEMNYDYWALGHIHKRAVHSESPCVVVMPGIPQGRHINEAGVKTVTLATFQDTGEIEIEERVTSLVQFERVDIDVTGIEDLQELITAFETAFDNLIDHIQTRHAIVRVSLNGTTPLAGKIRRDADVIESELKLAARRTGKLFVEKCELHCRATPDEFSSTNTDANTDPVSELRRLMTDQSMGHERITEEIKSLMTELQKKLPPELRDAFDDADGRRLSDYLNQGSEDILARLEDIQGRNDAL